MSLSLMFTVVSLAYKMQNNISDTLHNIMSFMYIINNIEPKIDPCGIQHFIDWVDECTGIS